MRFYLDGASNQACAGPCRGMLDDTEFLFVDRILSLAQASLELTAVLLLQLLEC